MLFPKTLKYVDTNIIFGNVDIVTRHSVKGAPPILLNYFIQGWPFDKEKKNTKKYILAKIFGECFCSMQQ